MAVSDGTDVPVAADQALMCKHCRCRIVSHGVEAAAIAVHVEHASHPGHLIAAGGSA